MQKFNIYTRTNFTQVAVYYLHTVGKSPSEEWHWPIPVAARSKAWVCGRSLAGIVGSNSAGGMDVCLLSVLCVLSGTGLCVALITRPDVPTECGVSECDH